MFSLCKCVTWWDFLCNLFIIIIDTALLAFLYKSPGFVTLKKKVFLAQWKQTTSLKLGIFQLYR